MRQSVRAKAQFYAFVIADHSLASGIWSLSKGQDLPQLVHWSRKFCMISVLLVIVVYVIVQMGRMRLLLY